ncbi:MAG: DUF748 domain-containing protein [Campylobacterota bacterium]|nr:DUF748 domain-containing protein [Campylobacterota bacterium]
MFGKIQKALLYFLLFYAFVGFIALPFILKPQLIEIIEQETNSKIEIDNISFNPFIFKLKISDVKLSSLDDKPLVSFKSFLVDLELYSLLNSAIHVKKITLEEPKIDLVYNKDKSINLLSILKPKESVSQEQSSSSTEMPRVIIDSLELSDGTLRYEDYTLQSKFDFSFGNIGFELKDIDTNDFNGSDAEIRFYSRLGDGGFVDFKSRVDGFKPFVLNGSLDFEASKLYSQWKYMQETLNLEVADGKISFHTDYHLNLDDLNATTIENLSLSLEKLRVKPKSKHKDVLNLDSLYLSGGTIKPMQRSVHLEKIALASLSLKAKRSESGEIDWLEYIKTEGTVDVNESEELAVDEDASSPEWNLLLDELSLEKIAVDFQDEGVKPAVLSRLNEFNFYAQDITLAGEKPFSYKMNMLINDALRCSSKGSVVHKVLSVKTESQCKGFDLVHYRPYIDELAEQNLKVYDLKLLNAVVGFNAKLDLEEIDSEVSIRVSDANLSLNEFKLSKRSTKEKLVDFRSFNVDGIKLDSAEKFVDIQKVSLNDLDIKTARLKDGTLNIDNIVVPKESKPTKKTVSKSKAEEKEYSVKLKHFALKAAQVGFSDKALTPHVKSKIDRIFLNAYNIDTKKKSWLNYRLYMRVNSKGILKADGKLRHTPLKQKGNIELEKLSLTELTPYLQEKAFVSLDDGKFSLKATTEYAKSSKSPDLKVNGSLKIQDIFLNDSRDASPITSFNTLGLQAFTLELFPNRLYIDELDLDAFYVNVKINENKEMNLAQLMKPNENNERQEEMKTQEINATEEPAFPVSILKMNVALGSAEFSDYSLPIKFGTNIHDLNGVIYSISNMPGEASYVDINGVVDKYGSTKLKGSVKSANPKEFTDLDFNFRNLNLSSVSGYSASFAGHEIDEGKLFLDLGYDIQNSKLVGSNSVIIKQIKLGKEIEDENITVLPLGFVIALLEDDEGIIEIDMPVEGNVDEPDFKYGALVMNTIGNLIVKAVTSPFRFLGSMMGMDGEALEYAEFEKGSSVVLPPEIEKLDQIAKMMRKRPKISLSLTPTYDASSDKRALQTQKLIASVIKESGIKNKQEHESAMTIDLLEDIYEDMRDDEAVDKLQESLEEEYEGDELKAAYFSALVELCKDIQSVTKVELETLAKDRADNLQNYLLHEKNIDSLRVIQSEIVSIDEQEDKLVKQTYSIKVK